MDYSKYKISELFYPGTPKTNSISIMKKRYVLEFQRRDKDGLPCFNHISQYIASKVFDILSIPCIKGELGTFHGREVFVYKDTIPPSNTFVPYKDIAEQLMDKSENLSIYNIDNILDNISYIDDIKDKQYVYDTFFKMIVVDTILANEGRDMVSWGFFVDNDRQYNLSPIFNNSFCLFSKASEYDVSKALCRKDLPRKYIYNTESCICLECEPALLEEIIRHKEYDELKDAIKYVLDKFNIKKINKIIDNIKYISLDRKEFIKRVIEERLKLVRSIYKENYGETS